MANDAAARLRALLYTERTLLLTGRLGGLAGLTAQKETLQAELATANIAALRDLRSLAEDNRRLLQAAQDGLRAAIARLAAIRSARNGLTAYTADGNSHHHGLAVSQVERRA